MNREVLIGLIIAEFEKNYETFVQTCDLSGLTEEYHRLLANKNQSVRILDKNNPWEGEAVGINAQGELLVKDQKGQTNAVRAGEVSVRGLYSYV